MCGVAGYIGTKPPELEKVERTLSLMKNRGPDYQSHIRVDGKDQVVDLLHSRLSIIDLDNRANQPFCLDECILVYNGEIYNYLELRKDLEKDGCDFHTNSDTEVLLRSYLKYGKDCVEKLEGMWSFAIYDKRKDELFLSRDRFAEKPLYFKRDKNGFYFGSEVKFIRQLRRTGLEINERHVFRHLTHGYKSLYKADETYFLGVKELKYATNLIVKNSSEIFTYCYWQPQIKINESLSLEDSIEGAKEKLLNSLRIRLRSDVPMAFCLSGGVDSAALASIACKVFGYNAHTFSIIDDDERYNEEGNILATINDLGCEHHLIKVEPGNAIVRLKKLVEYHDAPVATVTYYVHSMLSEAIANRGYRVAFSGTAADEIFTGYYDHFLFHLHTVSQESNFKQYLEEWQINIAAFIRNPLLKDYQNFINNPCFRDHIFDGSGEIKKYLKFDFCESFHEEKFVDSILRNRMMNEIFHEVTPVILHEDDLNSMFYSIENRSPYLDRHLFEFMNTVPSKYLIHDGYGKYILREAVKGILNDQVRLDRRKKGFNASINSMINLENPAVVDYLLEEKSALSDMIDFPKMRELFSMKQIPNHLSKFIFNFLNAKIFFDLY